MMARFTFLLITMMLLSLSSFADEWKQIAPGIEFDWPRDHGSHPDYRTEWWYFTGIVRDENDREYGYQLTFFRHGIDPTKPGENESALRVRHLVIGHFAIADIENKEFHKAERVRRKAPGFGHASTEGMDVRIDGWSLTRADGDVLTIAAEDAEHDFAITFELNPEKPLVFHGQNGYSQKGAQEGNASAYVTWTRLQTTGVMRIGDREFEATGYSWFDHEWGTSQLGEGVRGWDWFGLRLDDGRDLMAFYLRKDDGTIDPMSSGTLVDTDGSSRTLSRNDFRLTPLNTWTSPDTDATYPSQWLLEIPTENIALTITARIPNAEMGTTESTGTVYWEGPVSITGSHTGEGYAELTGYMESIANRFR